MNNTSSLQKKNIGKNFTLWSELVDFGIESALQMAKRRHMSFSKRLKLLKKAIDIQSMSHHKANIELLRKLQLL